jgi:diguanylate cyclase (GGDEF)-like protein
VGLRNADTKSTVAVNAALVPDPEPRRTDPARDAALVESYRRLAAVFHEVLSEQRPEVLLDRIADTLGELVPHQDLHIYEADEKRRQLVPVFAKGPWEEEVMASTIPYGQGITGWAVAHRSPVLANEAHLDPRVEFVPGTPPDPEALITVPLIARGSLKGALNIYRIGEDALFAEDEFELARWFADAAALALDNAQIRARLEHLAHTDSLTGLYNHRYFHERLRAELTRAGRAHDSLGLMMLDIDDFKRVNDVCGHGEGDEVLQTIAAVLRAAVRASDVVCRVGGEEFAAILPSCGAVDAVAMAARLKTGLAEVATDATGQITLSIGVALGPEHAMNARELLACAEAAMMTAKLRGKDQIVVFEESGGERPQDADGYRDVRSIAHLKLLQNLARKLNRSNDVTEIGEAIVDELRVLFDYNNCIVYLHEGDRLRPVAVRGVLENKPPEQLEFELGEGLTGRVAVTGKPMLVANVQESDICKRLDDSAANESLASVPLRHGQRVIGAITMAKLGVEQFDEDDLRLLEVVAGHASVALENARLYASARREAENATVWLEFADALSEAHSVETVGDEAVRTIRRVMEVEQASLWIEDAQAVNFRCLASLGYEEDPHAAAVPGLRTSRATGARLLDGKKTPFMLEGEEFRALLGEDADAAIRSAAIAPLNPGYGIRGWITVRAPEDDLAHFTDERLRLLEGLAYRASVALQKTVLLQSEQESAEVTGALLEFSRRLAGTAADDLRRRIVELTGEMLGSPRTWLWLERGRPGSFAIEAAWREDGAVPIVPIGSVVDFGGARRALEAGEPFVLEPGMMNMVPVGEDPLAVAPVVLPSGRIGCVAAAVPGEFPERKLRLLAGIANQASLALHIST